jgi:hypothetical protein
MRFSGRLKAYHRNDFVLDLGGKGDKAYEADGIDLGNCEFGMSAESRCGLTEARRAAIEICCCARVILTEICIALSFLVDRVKLRDVARLEAEVWLARASAPHRLDFTFDTCGMMLLVT